MYSLEYYALYYCPILLIICPLDYVKTVIIPKVEDQLLVADPLLVKDVVGEFSTVIVSSLMECMLDTPLLLLVGVSV